MNNLQVSRIPAFCGKALYTLKKKLFSNSMSGSRFNEYASRQVNLFGIIVECKALATAS
ncbi:hypothetical protein P7H74_06445 [Enterococcus devriesei]|uniref:hypothetical protein n=1 Tax=Enterococcus devriesei TaxID=319970 RepID=UPI001C11528B|nr:hypothetical protein [Enterococcus devriesei]MBU5364962.1 hypothetical protein [Enterococcus devriesei]MDT2821387.1 hypothetical protein [Enterococcus devriesei]